MNVKKFDVVKEVEKQYEELMNDDCQHCNKKGLGLFNRNYGGCGRIDPDTGIWYCYGSESYGSESYEHYECYIEDFFCDGVIVMNEDDPADLAAEMEQQEEYIENLFEKRDMYVQEEITINEFSG